MSARDQRSGTYTYVYLVENVREEGRTKQRIIVNLGRKEVVVARGDLDRLARSVVRLAQRSMVLSRVEGEAPPNARCQRIGPALLFERLWHEVGCRAVLEELAAGRQFEFAAERAVFLTVLHRLFVSGSDRAAEKWRADYRIGGTGALQLHHLYRAMAWLGEPPAAPTRARQLTPPCAQGPVGEGGRSRAQRIGGLEERKLEYVLGVRERSSAEVRSTVIDDQTPFVPLVVPRVSGELTELEAKQVKIGNRRYIVCRNLAEARRDAEQRSAILDGLRAKLAQSLPPAKAGGDKALA